MKSLYRLKIPNKNQSKKIRIKIKMNKNNNNTLPIGVQTLNIMKILVQIKKKNR